MSKTRHSCNNRKAKGSLLNNKCSASSWKQRPLTLFPNTMGKEPFHRLRFPCEAVYCGLARCRCPRKPWNRRGDAWKLYISNFEAWRKNSNFLSIFKCAAVSYHRQFRIKHMNLLSSPHWSASRVLPLQASEFLETRRWRVISRSYSWHRPWSRCGQGTDLNFPILSWSVKVWLLLRQVGPCLALPSTVKTDVTNV